MKSKIILIAILSIVLQSLGQTPGIQYQAILYDTTKTLSKKPNYLSNKEIIVRFTIKDQNNNILYEEEQDTKTDNFGAINLVVGRGIVLPQTPTYTRVLNFDDGTSLLRKAKIFDEIDWNGEPRFLYVEVCSGNDLYKFDLIDIKEINYIPYEFHNNLLAFGTLEVDGKTTLEGDFVVRRQKPAIMSGTLTAEDALFNGVLDVKKSAIINGKVEINPHQIENSHNIIVNTSSKKGMVIRLQNTKSENSFVSFNGKSRKPSVNDIVTHGSITGLQIEDIAKSPEFIYQNSYYLAALVTQILSLVFAGIESPLSVFSVVIETIKLFFLLQEIASFNAFCLTQTGVSYNSSWGDYAEWLEKADPNEQFTYGEVVGVHNGKISRNLINADHVLVISKNPIVLGNVPQNKENFDKGEKVAFMGQVQVWVEGQVKQGDIIVGKDDNSGVAIAVSKDKLTIDMIPRIIGVASNFNIFEGKKLVNVIIGIRMNEWQSIVEHNIAELAKLENELNDLNQQIEESNTKLEQIYNQKSKNNQKTQLNAFGRFFKNVLSILNI